MPNSFQPGQRWVSESEPELGLGSVLRVGERTVTLSFGASGETREYAQGNAPLRRVRFRAGDSIKNREGATLVVRDFSESQGLFTYHGEQFELCETELSNTISFNKPEERLLAGQVDEPLAFDLRLNALHHQHRQRKSRICGFVGGRIDLIPHQLFISSEVANRLVPRVLLADEVGLGKTIEACLILHRLIITGRVQRALILLPESLIHQWFVELLRRFNLWFHIFDEERCESIQSVNPDANPFLDDQLVLSSLSLFTNNPKRAQQAEEAGWDILVVDEAHHLGWSPEQASEKYAVVERLGRKIPGLLLLTATPEQLGMASHFARLRLLDPDRFFDLNEFIQEAEQYRNVARLVEKLLKNESLQSAEEKFLAQILLESEESIRSQLSQTEQARQKLIDALLDRHGTGRVMFRNTRNTVSGFPQRKARLHELSPPADSSDLFDHLATEFAEDTRQKKNDAQHSGAKPNPPLPMQLNRDPRIDWLANLLRELREEKILLICRTQQKVEAIDAALRQRLNVKMAMFHEGIPLVQRDRSAAWFAEDDGARILISSEIGSEGRNFQFAHHLVLFDLPLDPELLEQRIGRLDRIGQTSEIHVHVPYVKGSSQEVLARWYHEGLCSFEKNLHGARELLERFGTEVHDLAQDFHETQQTRRADLDQLIKETQVARAELTVRLEEGRDRLLELNSFRPETATRLVKEIAAQDEDRSVDDFLLSIFDSLAIHVEELSPRTYQLGSAGVFTDSFPGLPSEGLTVTCDRSRALSREDIQFLTWDHPLVTGALDLLLGSEKGNCSFAKWPDKTPGFYLETIYILECIAPPHLHIDRFLPPTPLRIVVDHRGNDVGAVVTSKLLSRILKKSDPYLVLDRPELRDELLPMLIEKTNVIATQTIPPVIAQARREQTAQLDYEINRLKELQKINRTVRDNEINLLLTQKSALIEKLNQARLRLDAIRLIQRGAD